jgi:hypothetical protein
VIDLPDCPTPAVPVGGTVYPACYNNDCNSFGIRKTYDFYTKSTSNFAITTVSAYPYMQQDLGANAPNITYVRITSRNGPGTQFISQASNVNVYLSATPTWNGTQSVVCAYDLDFTYDGETATLLCPVGYTFTPRYLTVWMNSTARIPMSFAEITALYEGKWQHPCWGGVGLQDTPDRNCVCL